MLGLNPKHNNSSSKPTLSVVTPIYNEEGNVDTLVSQLTKVAESIGDTYELIFVNDGSTDQSLALLEQAAQKDKNIKVVSFSRNFGHQIALTAGLEHSQGAAVVVIDGDLQDPPELIKDMLTKWKEGYDVVYAVRTKRKGESFLKKCTAKIFYKILKFITKFDIPVDTGDFRLMSRRVVDVFLKMPERQRYVRGMVAWAGFKQTGLPYERSERHQGKTHYTYGKMIRFALDGVTSFSYIPLQLASLFGFICSIIGFLSIIYVLYSKFFDDQVVRGWASTFLVVIFLGGIQLMMIGVLGEYIGRIHTEQKKRPLYVVAKTINFSDES